jgi:hypothetical protein
MLRDLYPSLDTQSAQQVDQALRRVSMASPLWPYETQLAVPLLGKFAVQSLTSLVIEL